MITDQIADDLTATVNAAAERLQSLDETVVSHRPTPDRWMIKEVMGHLIDSAANNHQRFVRGQFVDELVLPKYEQNQWVSGQGYADADWGDIVELWRRYNLHLARVIRRVPPKAFGVRCVIGDYPPVTLEFLMTDYLVHMKHHLQKIWERLGGKA